MASFNVADWKIANRKTYSSLSVIFRNFWLSSALTLCSVVFLQTAQTDDVFAFETPLSSREESGNQRSAGLQIIETEKYEKSKCIKQAKHEL